MMFLLRRVLWSLPMLWGVLTVVFLLQHLIPGDPIDLLLGEQALTADREALRQRLGLHLPLPEQYLRYGWNVLRGDWGESLRTNQPVLSIITARFPATLELLAAAMLVSCLLALPLGTLAALYRGKWLDQALGAFAVLGVAMPNFWLGPLLVVFFSLQLDWLPVNERGGLDSLILPAITLGTALAALLSRITRSSLVEVFQEDYLRTAKAKGVGMWRRLLVHAVRNAALPVVTIIGLQMGALLSGAIITEHIFDWPGLGSLLLEGIYSRDYPVVQGCVLVIAAGYLMINTVVDLLYQWINPKIESF